MATGEEKIELNPGTIDYVMSMMPSRNENLDPKLVIDSLLNDNYATDDNYHVELKPGDYVGIDTFQIHECFQKLMWPLGNVYQQLETCVELLESFSRLVESGLEEMSSSLSSSDNDSSSPKLLKSLLLIKEHMMCAKLSNHHSLEIYGMISSLFFSPKSKMDLDDIKMKLPDGIDLIVNKKEQTDDGEEQDGDYGDDYDDYEDDEDYDPDIFNDPDYKANGTEPKTDLLNSEIKSENADNNEEHWCKDCTKTFTSSKLLKRHVSRFHSDEPKECKCESCGKCYTTTAKLKRHIKQSHEGGGAGGGTDKKAAPKKTCVCEACGKVCLGEGALKRHVKYIHEMPTPKKFPCEFCGAEFSRKVLAVHVKGVHGNEKTEPCSFCGKTFALHTSLKIHIDSVHKKIKRAQCNICGKEFFKKGHMDRHIREAHERRVAAKCQICGKEFGQKSNLTVHLRTVHRKERNYNCTICLQAFTTLQSVQLHTKNVHKVTYP